MKDLDEILDYYYKTGFPPAATPEVLLALIEALDDLERRYEELLETTETLVEGFHAEMRRFVP